MHRVLYGLVERFVAVLRASGGRLRCSADGAVVIIPIGKKHPAYAEEVGEKLKAAGVRVPVDAHNEESLR